MLPAVLLGSVPASCAYCFTFGGRCGTYLAHHELESVSMINMSY